MRSCQKIAWLMFKSRHCVCWIWTVSALSIRRSFSAAIWPTASHTHKQTHYRVKLVDMWQMCPTMLLETAVYPCVCPWALQTLTLIPSQTQQATLKHANMDHKAQIHTGDFVWVSLFPDLNLPSSLSESFIGSRRILEHTGAVCSLFSKQKVMFCIWVLAREDFERYRS